MNHAVLLLFATSVLWGQTGTVSLGLLDLRLGMTKAEVKAIACKAYAELCSEGFARLWELDMFTVPDLLDFQRGTAQPLRLLGDLYFADGRLVTISRNWTPEATDITTFVRAVHGLISDLNPTGRALATVKATTYRDPEMKFETIAISFGTRSVVIQVTEGSLGGHRVRSVQLTEEYSTPGHGR
jgi:hypothetical protein